jgi:DNA-binding LacI/PurR family transcriptional regulator
MARPTRPATLKDIAREVGVDISTVSKVLKDGSISVRPQTRQAIVDEARRLRYRPHAVARNLRQQRTGALGILVTDLTNPIYAVSVRGAVRRAEEIGYVMLLAEVPDEYTLANVYTRLVSERCIDGLIITGSTNTDEVIAAIEEYPIPHVLIYRRGPRAGISVTVDDESAGRLAANTLIRAGHRELGFIGGSDDMDTARRRRAGFTAACRAAGLPQVAVSLGPYSRRGGYESCLKLLDSTERPTGIFASNNLVGTGALAAARERGVQVPRDLSVITIDAEDAIYSAPPMTAIRMPLGEMGARSVEELDAIIRGEQPKDVVLDIAPELVERDSVAPPSR